MLATLDKLLEVLGVEGRHQLHLCECEPAFSQRQC
jgi:hypothetical protein